MRLIQPLRVRTTAAQQSTTYGASGLAIGIALGVQSELQRAKSALGLDSLLQLHSVGAALGGANESTFSALLIPASPKVYCLPSSYVPQDVEAARGH